MDSPIGAQIGPSGAKGPRCDRLSAAEDNPRVLKAFFRKSTHIDHYSGSDSRSAQFPRRPSGNFTDPHDEGARFEPAIGPNFGAVSFKPSGNHWGKFDAYQFSSILGLGRALSLCGSVKLPLGRSGNGAGRLPDPGQVPKREDFRKKPSVRAGLLPRCPNRPLVAKGPPMAD